MYRLSWLHRCTLSRTDRSFSFTSSRDGSMAAANAAECCNSIDRPRKWIPNGGRHCEQRGRTISLVMETACRGNRQRSEKGGYIHKGRKCRTKVEKGSREGISNKKRRGKEKGRVRRGGRRGENLPIYPLLDSLSLFFFRPVEIVNGFLLGDLPRSVNASAD